MQKRGRPASKNPTEQVTVRLPVAMLDQFRRHGKGVSAEIQARLVNSLGDDQADPYSRDLAGQVERLAIEVHRTLGTKWNECEAAYLAFVETLKLLLADLPKPREKSSTIDADPSVAARLIYNRYKAVIDDYEQGRTLRVRPTVRYLLENDQASKRKKP